MWSAEGKGEVIREGPRRGAKNGNGVWGTGGEGAHKGRLYRVRRGVIGRMGNDKGQGRTVGSFGLRRGNSAGARGQLLLAILDLDCKQDIWKMIDISNSACYKFPVVAAGAGRVGIRRAKLAPCPTRIN